MVVRINIFSESIQHLCEGFQRLNIQTFAFNAALEAFAKYVEDFHKKREVRNVNSADRHKPASVHDMIFAKFNIPHSKTPACKSPTLLFLVYLCLASRFITGCCSFSSLFFHLLAVFRHKSFTALRPPPEAAFAPFRFRQARLKYPLNTHPSTATPNIIRLIRCTFRQVFG